MIEHIGGNECATHSMMQYHIANGEQKGDPVLIEGDEDDDHEKMGVHLDMAT
jgi:hypothetical protein